MSNFVDAIIYIIMIGVSLVSLVGISLALLARWRIHHDE